MVGLLSGTYRHCYGNFTASSGSLALTNTQVFGEDHGTVGGTLHAYGDSTNRTVTVISGEEDFTDVYIAAVFLVIWAGIFYFLIHRPVRRCRRQRSLSTGSELSQEN